MLSTAFRSRGLFHSSKVLSSAAAAAAGGATTTTKNKPKAPLPIDRIKPDGTSIKFFKRADVAKSKDEKGKPYYVINLDDRQILTASKGVLGSHSELMAWAIANEWQSQHARIIPATMPLLILEVTAIDISRSSDGRKHIIQSLERKFSCDLVTIRSEEPEELCKLEDEAWNPLIEWVNSKLGIKMNYSSDMFATDQPEESEKKMHQLLIGLNPAMLAAVESVAGITGSLVIALATVYGRITPAEALASSRVHERYQVTRWGEVEGGHDVDEADLLMRLSAVNVFVQCHQLQN